MVTSPSSHMVSQQTPPTSLRGVSPGYPASVDNNARQMKGVFVPTPSPYDPSPSAQSQPPAVMGDIGGPLETHALMGGTMDTINGKQVTRLNFSKAICVLISC